MANPTKSPASSDKPHILKIDSHSALAEAQHEIVKRLHANPDIAQLLLVNPLSAFQDIGVKVSPGIASHILHTLQNSPETAARRQVLMKELTHAAGEPPRPSDPAWVSKFVFHTLKLKPLHTEGAVAVYKPTSDPAIAAKQMAAIPRLNTAPALPHPDHGTAFVFDSITPSVRHLDLEKHAPKLRHTKEAPAALDLATLYFYKDLDPRVKDLLELGIIETQSFQASSPDVYRKIKSGEMPNPWGWITGIKFTAPKK